MIKQNSKSAIPLSVSHRELKTKATTQNSQAISSYFYEKSYTLKSSKNLYVLLCSYIQINNNIIIGNITKETILEDNLTLRKALEHGTIKEVTAKQVQERLTKSEEYLKRLDKLFIFLNPKKILIKRHHQLKKLFL